jgi:uncharacterized protein YidB (DUF937 family)
MGLLEDVIGGVLKGGTGGSARAPEGQARSGGMSPMLMALMAYLAYRTLSGGKSSAGAPGDAPVRVPGGGAGGGLGDILGEILGGGSSGGPAPGGARTRAPSDETGGGLGGILGGRSPSSATTGQRGSGLDELSDIVERFDKNGQGDIARSWVSPDENKQLSPDQMGAVLDPGTADRLAEATGLDRDELLAGLAQTLPGVVDRLTPNGRMPTPQEWQRLL